MLVVLLDSYHLGDPLFIPQLARDVAARKAGAVFVHGSGEAGERVLESRGLVPEAVAGVWAVSTPEEAAEVERATRDLNRRIVHEMNEAGTPAVRVMAADRGLARRDADGTIRAGRTAWLATLAAQGGVAVVAALVAGDGSARVEADAAAVAVAIAEALGADGVALVGTGRVAALADATAPVPLADAQAAGALADAGLAARTVALSTVPVRLVSAASLRSQSPPDGPMLTA